MVPRGDQHFLWRRDKETGWVLRVGPWDPEGERKVVGAAAEGGRERAS